MTSKHKINLLQLLLEQDQFQPAKFFTDKIGVSAKTVYKYVEELTQELAPFQLNILKVPRKGLLIEGSDKDKYKARVLIDGKADEDSFSVAFRRLYLFSQLLFKDEVFSYQHYADYFFVSVQSIKRDIDELLLYCEKQKIYVHRRAKGVEVSGDERRIQNSYKDYFEELNKQATFNNEQLDLLFSNDIVTTAEAFIYKLVAHDSVHVPNEYLLKSLKISLVVLLNRLRNQHHLPEESSLLFEQIEKMKLYMTALELSDQSEKKLDITFQNFDIYFLCSLLLAYGIEPISHDKHINQKVQYSIRRMVTRLSNLIECDLSQDERLFQSLISHAIPMIYRLQAGIAVQNPLKTEIMQQYSTMYMLTSYSSIQLEDDFSIVLTDDELSFLTIHFQLAFEKVQSVKHLLIVCPSGLGTSQLIYQRINQSIPSNNVLEIVDLKTLETVDLDTVDLLISTVQLTNIDRPILYVSPLPTGQELAQINAQISGIESNQKTFMNETNKNLRFLELSLDEAFIFTNCSVSNQQEAMDFLATAYEDKGLVREGFRSKLYEREALGTTGLNTGVAIPHADPEAVKNTCLGIMTLAQPIRWGVHDVSLIIMLAIAEKDMHYARTMIASIYELLSSPKNVQELVAIKESKQIKEMILMKGAKPNEQLF